MEKVWEEKVQSGEQGLVQERLWTLNFILICFSAFASFLAFHSLHPTLPIYIEKFGGTAKIAGLALTSLTVAAIFSRPVTGWAQMCIRDRCWESQQRVGSDFLVIY